jgi:hypothetical protein
MRESGDRFAAEAPEQVEMGGHWISPMGLAGSYVNADGLARLQKTDLFDQVRFDTRAGRGQHHNDAVATFVASLDPSWYVGHPSPPQGRSEGTGPLVHINLTPRGYLALSHDERVRSVQLLSRKPRKPDVDSELEAAIAAEGSVRAWVSLSDHAAYRSGLQGSDREAMVLAHKKAFERFQRKAGYEVLAGFEEFGAQLVQLDARGLQALRHLPWMRSVRLDKPTASTQLSNSTSAGAIGMPRLWNQGHCGTGQTIAILDTGIEKNHLFLKNHSGVSRVTYEACFGTNTGGDKSPCPSPNANGDSPAGLVGAGAPANPATYCATAATNCSAHGTYSNARALGQGAGVRPLCRHHQVAPYSIAVMGFNCVFI